MKYLTRVAYVTRVATGNYKFITPGLIKNFKTFMK